MRIEILIALITGAIAYNVYTEGAFLKKMLSYKKYYQIGGIIFAALVIYWLIKKNPENAKNIIMTGNDYIKYLPLDRSTTSFITPILDMTSRMQGEPAAAAYGGVGGEYGTIAGHPIVNLNDVAQQKMGGRHGGGTGTATKRNVSETKKKFVAYNQGWKCSHCNSLLNHTYEIDHKIRLEYGGSNDVSNLEALCRNCHGKKTANENMGL